MLKGHST